MRRRRPENPRSDTGAYGISDTVAYGVSVTGAYRISHTSAHRVTYSCTSDACAANTGASDPSPDRVPYQISDSSAERGCVRLQRRLRD